ncbi:MAG TPA: 23S rRNA (guanosine(2251)-2'-O)-methyltransferase RlmB [Streptosporangiaceae bacterium]
MAKRRKKGPSFTPKAEDRHWYGRRQAARAAKSSVRTGTWTTGPANRAPAAARAGSGAASGAGAAEVVAGRNAVVEALRAGVPGTALYVMSATDERVREAIMLAGDTRMPLLETGKAELDRLTDGAVHQGIAMRVRQYRYAHPDDLPGRATTPLIVAVDGVTDPRNLGAIARSAAAFGATGVVIPERRAAGVTAAVWKSSAGALADIPVARATNLTRALRSYQNAGLFVAGLDAGAGTAVADLQLATDPLVLVVGAEGRGLSRLVAEACDVLVGIPMPGKAESLNVGVATGIALYEISRRRAA